MALSWLAQKIFGQKDKCLIEPQWCPKIPNYKLDNCRMLILRESSHGHKSLLYDSTNLVKCSADDYDVKINEIGFKIDTRINKDVKDLSEKMYGTLPITNQSDTIKVMILKTSIRKMWMNWQ